MVRRARDDPPLVIMGFWLLEPPESHDHDAGTCCGASYFEMAAVVTCLVAVVTCLVTVMTCLAAMWVTTVTGTPAPPGAGVKVVFPVVAEVVIRPIELPPWLVNHTAPSGPAVIPCASSMPAAV